MNRAANLSFGEKLSYGMGAIGKDLVFATISGFYMMYLTQVVGLTGFIVGIVFAIARAWDAFNDPIMGSFVDNTRSKWGKFRPWLALGTLLNAIVVILMFADFNLPNLAEYYYYLIIYVIWGMSYTIVDIPYWSLIPAISGTPEERNSISSLARIFASAGGFIATALMPMVLGEFGWGREIFFSSGVVLAGCFVFFMAFTVIFTREKIIGISEKVKIREILRIIIDNDQLLAYFASFGLFACAAIIITHSGMYYFKIVLDNEQLLTFFLITGGIGGMGVAMFIYPLLARRFGRRPVYIAAMIIAITGFFTLTTSSFILGGTNAMALFWLFSGGWMVMFANGLASVGATVMLADIVDYGEWKSGNRTENITFSAQCLAYKFATAISALITGAAVSIGNIPTINPDGTFYGEVTAAGKDVITFAIFTLPVVFVILGLFFYIKYFKFYGAYQEKIMQELNSRHRDKGTGSLSHLPSSNNTFNDSGYP